MAFNKKQKISFVLLFAILFSLISVNVLSVFVSIRQMWFYDFKGQWAISAYILKGIDPYLLTGTGQVPDLSIGAVPKLFGTVPWGMFLGNLVYGGFLPRQYACIYYITVTQLVLAYTSYLLSKQFNDNSKAIRVFVFFISFLSINSFVSLVYGNAGVICCALVIIAIIKLEENPFVSGICLSVAMIKPQVALLFCLELLLQKKYKALITAAGIDISFYAAVCIMLKKSPVMLLKEFLSVDIGGENKWVGFFTFLKYMGGNEKAAMVLSMLFGISFVLLFHFKIPDNVPKFYRFIPACIAETFWCYCWWNDQFVMIIPALSCIALMIEDKGKLNILKQSVFLYLCLFKQAFIFINALPISSVYSDNSNLFFIIWYFENPVLILVIIAICIYNIKRLKEIYPHKT